MTGLPNDFVSIDPTFTILDPSKVEEACKAMIEATKKEEGVLYYGFVRTETTLLCVEAYKDGEAVKKHLENVGPILTASLEAGTIKLDSLKIQGPKEQLEIVKPATDPLGAEYYETIQEGITFMQSMVGKEDTNKVMVSAYPIFTVPDWPKAEEQLKQFIADTSAESKCHFYGFTKHDDKLICRESYHSGEGLLEHLGVNGERLGKCLEEGIIKLEVLKLLGPKEELEKLKEAGEPFGAIMMEYMGGFTRFSVRRWLLTIIFFHNNKRGRFGSYHSLSHSRLFRTRQ